MNDTALVLVPVLVWLVFCFLVGRAAVLLGRSPVPWIVLAIFLSPLAA